MKAKWYYDRTETGHDFGIIEIDSESAIDKEVMELFNNGASTRTVTIEYVDENELPTPPETPRTYLKVTMA